MSEQNKNQEFLRQYLESINDKKERKKAEKNVRLSRLNMGITVLLSLLIPIAGYAYTGRWKALLWLCLVGSSGLILFNIMMEIIGEFSQFTKDETMKKIIDSLSIIIPIVATIDNSLAIFRARKQLETINK